MCHACAAPKYVPLPPASTATSRPAHALKRCPVVIHPVRCPVPPTVTAAPPPAVLLRVTSTALRRSTFADRPVLPAHIATKQLVESALPAPQENGRRALTLSAISSASRALLEDGPRSLACHRTKIAHLVHLGGTRDPSDLTRFAPPVQSDSNNQTMEPATAFPAFLVSFNPKRRSPTVLSAQLTRM